MNIVFDGTITPRTPLAIVPPPPEDKKADRMGRLPRMPVFLDGVRHETAYIPASSIRGRLRHTAVALVIDTLKQAGKPSLTLNDYLFNALGGVFDRKDDEEDPTKGVDLTAMASVRETNPLISLFGAMTVKLGGKLRTGMAVPRVPFEPEAINPGVRMNPFQRDPDLLQQFSADEQRQFLETNRQRVLGNQLKGEAKQVDLKLRRMRRENAAPEQVEQLDKQRTDALARAEAAFDAAGGEVNLQQPLPGYEALPIGLEMTHRMTLVDPTPLELALFLATLERFAADPRLGGHASHESGLIAAHWAVRVHDAGGGTPAGDIGIDPDKGFVANLGHPLLQAALQAKATMAEQLARCIFSQPKGL